MAVPRPDTATEHGARVSRDAPIGIFDSGFGGLTVARAVLDQLPHESISYFGDTARQPYGPRPIAQVRAYALECLDLLVDSGIKMLVIACNSASGAVLRDARERYDIPVVEVIRPAVRLAVAATRNQHVGVISTRSTRRSMAYDDAFAAAPQIRLTSQDCPRFVEFVEAGVTGGEELLAAAHEYLDPVVAAGVDTLILGCTHYPLLTGVISYVMGEDVVLINSADETAKDVYRILAENSTMRSDGLAEPAHCFTTTGDPDQFREIGQRFLGPEIGVVSHTLPDRSVVAGLATVLSQSTAPTATTAPTAPTAPTATTASTAESTALAEPVEPIEAEYV